MQERHFKLLEASYIKETKSQLLESYHQFIEDLRIDVKEGADSTYLSQDFQSELKKIVFQEELDNYSPLNYYWSFLIEDMIEHIGLLEELSENDELEDEMIDYLTHSEFAGAFLELYEEHGAFESSKMILEMKELRAISFFKVQINQDSWQPSGPVSYQAVPEVGDTEDALFIRDKIFYLKDLSEFYPTFPVVSFNPKQGSLELEDDQDLVEIQGVKKDSSITMNKKIFEVLIKEKDEELNARIQRALGIIYKYHPDLFFLVSTFSSYIVPIHEEGIVSFSMESLPEYSSINTYDRDFVDLVDDLVHENGHHYLNAHLSFCDLIIEDDELIFCSPWRRASRPIRGLYHAFFTFYWAYELFYTLHLKAQQEFSESENEKILFRLCEEFFYLEECLAQLQAAFRMQKITEDGMQLIQHMIESIQSQKQEIENLEKSLTSDKKEELNKIKQKTIEMIKKSTSF